MESKSFVDKVYDSYIKEDYSYGDDNLNPKRELRKMTLRDTDDQLNHILESIQLKVKEISLKYPSKDFKSDDAIGNFGGSGRQLGLPNSVREAINKTGGNGDMIIMIPSMDGDASPLMGEIEITIAKILATLQPNLNKGSKISDIADGLGDSGLDLFNIDCNGTVNAIDGSENSDTDEDDDSADDGSDDSSAGDNDSDSDDGDDGDDSDDGDDESGGEPGSGDSSSDSETDTDDDRLNGDGNSSGSGEDESDSEDYTDSSDDSSDAVDEAAVDEALAQMDENVANNEVSAAECAMKDLGLMKAFLAILKVIQAIKKALNPLMNILYDTVRIVVLAAGCWNNPTNISEIVQRIIVKIMAILVMIIAMLVQMFWEMLGLDCLTSQAKDVIDQIKEALTGVASTYNKCERLAVSFGADVNKVKDAFSEAKDAIDEAMANLSSDHIKEMLEEQGSSLKDVAENIYNNKDNFTKETKTALQNTGAYNNIMDTLESIKSLREEADTTIKAIMQSKGGKAADATVKKIASQLHDVKAV